MPWGKKWPVQMNLPFFAVKAYVPGGVQNQAEKKFEKCLPAGTGTKNYFSSTIVVICNEVRLGKGPKLASKVRKCRRRTKTPEPSILPAQDPKEKARCRDTPTRKIPQILCDLA